MKVKPDCLLRSILISSQAFLFENQLLKNTKILGGTMKLPAWLWYPFINQQ
jgi:hypothetical protein